MKQIFLIALVFFLFSACSKEEGQISLDGTWQLLLDSTDQFQDEDIPEMEFSQTIHLPGTLDEAGIGKALRSDSSLTREVMLTLARKFTYVGPAYYCRELRIPESWEGKRIQLTMERVIWKSSVWVDGNPAGSENSLSTPHRYDLTDLLSPGKHTLTVCIDNRRQVNINKSDYAHAYTNQTQIKWNGILGDLNLRAFPATFIDQVQLFPDPATGEVSGKITVAGNPGDGNKFRIILRDPRGNTLAMSDHTIDGKETHFRIKSDSRVQGWSEMDPVLYKLEVSLLNESGGLSDQTTESFGYRKIEKRDGHIVLNGEKIFLRGTLECAIFPLTGHPPLSKEEWRKLMIKAKDYGLNHLRFHSWCPPEAAFEAADEMGFYLQPELPNWSLSYGEDPEVVEFIEAEAERIIREYGNHPSFVMFCMGNELMGDYDLINGLVKGLKEQDDR